MIQEIEFFNNNSDINVSLFTGIENNINVYKSIFDYKSINNYKSNKNIND